MPDEQSGAASQQDEELVPMPEIGGVGEMRERASMLNWWPTLRDADVPTPETVIVDAEPTEWEMGKLPNGDLDVWTVREPDYGAVQAAVQDVGGPPAFVRTDQASGKHSMASASRIGSLGEAKDVTKALIHENLKAGLVGLPYKAIVVREWLDLKHEFTAFDDTPIASELRFFVHDGEVHDYGFYWPDDAIERPDRGDWRPLLAQIREHALAEGEREVYELAERVAPRFEGYWSVDFAETIDGQWYAIDAAPGRASWHPESCEPPEAIA